MVQAPASQRAAGVKGQLVAGGLAGARAAASGGRFSFWSLERETLTVAGNLPHNYVVGQKSRSF